MLTREDFREECIRNLERQFTSDYMEYFFKEEIKAYSDLYEIYFPPMKQGEEKMITEQEKKQAKENIAKEVKQASTLLGLFVEVIKENPEIKDNAQFVLEQYADIFEPLIDRFHESSTNMREEAFNRFKRMGLSDELAVKLVCGR